MSRNSFLGKHLYRVILVMGLAAMFILLPSGWCFFLKNQTAIDLTRQLMQRTSYAIDTKAQARLQMLSMCPSSADFLGRTYFWAGNTSYAKHWFSQAESVSQNTQSSDWLYILGLNTTRLENYDVSERALRLYVELNPDSGKGYLGLGNLFRSRGEYEQARAVYEKAMQVEPAFSARAYFLIGQTYLDKGDALNGLEPLLQALEFDDQDHSLDITQRMAANYWIGVGYLYQNNLVVSERYLRHVLQLQNETNSDVTWIICGSKLILGLSLSRQGLRAEASSILNEVVNTCAGSPSDVSAAQAELKIISELR